MKFQNAVTTIKDGERATFFDGVGYKVSTAFSPIDLAVLGSLSEKWASANGDLYDFKGKVSIFGYADKWLTDSQVKELTDSLITEHTTITGSAPTNPDAIWITEGDSITVLNNPYHNQYFRSSTNNIYGKNFAVSGDDLDDLEARLSTVTATIAEVISRGITPIVSVLIGANGIPTMVDLQAYWTKCCGNFISHTIEKCSSFAIFYCCNNYMKAFVFYI